MKAADDLATKSHKMLMIVMVELVDEILMEIDMRIYSNLILNRHLSP